eukprot:gb/GEZN01015588.1/.p1 GENE.gb/GEZN01015588.1/~~gb/GEZN01015588.1/.p1  ORF type:complete len:261 (+),score=30.19 gb/GEZN01015588.1/:111-785(+)
MAMPATLPHLPQMVAHMFGRHCFHAAMLDTLYKEVPELRPPFQDERGPLRWVLIAAAQVFAEAAFPVLDRVQVFNALALPLMTNQAETPNQESKDAAPSPNLKSLVALDILQQDLSWRWACALAPAYYERKITQPDFEAWLSSSGGLPPESWPNADWVNLVGSAHVYAYGCGKELVRAYLDTQPGENLLSKLHDFVCRPPTPRAMLEVLKAHRESTTGIKDKAP